MNLKCNKKIVDKDMRFFNKIEEYLYNELSMSLNISFDDTKEYIINKAEELYD
jgi:hypothetical protein